MSHWSEIKGEILDKQDFEKLSLFITLNCTSCNLAHGISKRSLRFTLSHHDSDGSTPHSCSQAVLILSDESDSAAIS